VVRYITNRRWLVVRDAPHASRGRARLLPPATARHDPQVTVLLHSAQDPWDWAEVRGYVIETIDGCPCS
jgi:hypothetical protein